MKRTIFFFSTILLLNLACGSKSETASTVGQPEKAPSKTSSENYMSLKINGVEWKADNNIFGAFHPKGYNKAIIIAGSKGPKDKNEQPFNINLYNTAGPGVFEIRDGNPDLNVVQLANVTPENYIYGSMMGFKMKVTVTKASSNPDEIEATFEGEMNGNTGDVLKITDGKFYYHE